MNINFNRNGNWSYQDAIKECKRIGAGYRFIRYENGGMMLAVESPSYGWMPFRGTACFGSPVN